MTKQLRSHTPTKRGLINTPLQRGARAGGEDLNRFSGFRSITDCPTMLETAKAVHLTTAPLATPLKRGDNEKPLRASFVVAQIFSLLETMPGGNSKKQLEFLDREAAIFDDLAHCECVDWIVAGNHDNSHAVAHDRVLAFANNMKPCFLQSANGGL